MKFSTFSSLAVLLASTGAYGAATPAPTTPMPVYDNNLGCWPISVEHDATYCIDGPICSGSGPQPAGWKCPIKGHIAIADCHTYVASYMGDKGCVLPVDTTCQVIKTGAWGCVSSGYPTPIPTKYGESYHTPAPTKYGSNVEGNPTPAPTKYGESYHTPAPTKYGSNVEGNPTPAPTTYGSSPGGEHTPAPTNNGGEEHRNHGVDTPAPTTYNGSSGGQGQQSQGGGMSSGSGNYGKRSYETISTAMADKVGGVSASVIGAVGTAAAAIAAIAGVAIYKQYTKKARKEDESTTMVDVVTP